MSKPTKVYPLTRRWVHGHPAAVHVVDTKAEAEELVATGAFTLDPNDPERDHEAADLTASEATEPPEEPEPEPVPA